MQCTIAIDVITKKEAWWSSSDGSNKGPTIVLDGVLFSGGKNVPFEVLGDP